MVTADVCVRAVRGEIELLSQDRARRTSGSWATSPRPPASSSPPPRLRARLATRGRSVAFKQPGTQPFEQGRPAGDTM